MENSLPFNKKINSLLSILEHSKKNSDKRCISNCFRRLGIVYYENGLLDSATSNFLKAATISDQIQDYYSSASNYNQLGIIHYSLNSYADAIYYFKKAYKGYNELFIYKGVSDATNNLAGIYGLLDSLERMYEYSQISFQARIQSKDTTEIGYNYNSLGMYHFKKGNFDSAIKYLNLSISSFILTKDTFALIPAYNNMGELYLVLKIYEQAIYYFEKVSLSKYQEKNTFEYVNVLFNLAEAYSKKQDYKSAFEYLYKSDRLNDSLKKVVLQNAFIDANTKYETEAKNREIADNLRTITEQQAEIKIRSLWLMVTIIFAVSVLIISLLLIRTYRNKRRLAQNESELQTKRVDDLLQKHEVENVNAMLKGQDAERKRIAQELHDRLGSILSTVKLHFSNVEDQMNALKQQQNQSYQEATTLLDEAVDEVRRISHDLYEGSLVKFGFKTALLQLIAAIEKANTVKIVFIDNGLDNSLYKEFEQELYRITQELLSNTLKYANATEITIQLSAKGTGFEYMYEDNGKGFDKKLIEAGEGIGYKNIAARVGKMGGKWHIDTQPGYGMTLLIEISNETD